MIYLDNAATSFPKPKEVVNEITKCMLQYCGNPGRAGHTNSMKSAEAVYKTRKLAGTLINAPDPERIVFTSNATEALNLGIKSILKSGDHVITTIMEHNSVLRPLKTLSDKGVLVSVVNCNEEGIVQTEAIEKEIISETKMIICTHASNVTGGIMPISEIGRLAKKHRILFMVDSSQSIGILDIDVKEMNIDVLAAPGHKSLLGPMGTGFLYTNKNINLTALKEGGTGTDSLDFNQPMQMPDGFEAGTINVPGIAGLGKAIELILDTGISTIKNHEQSLIDVLNHRLAGGNGNIVFYGPSESSRKTGVLAFNIKGLQSETVAETLNREYDIAVRAGYQCAPLAHKHFKTLETGIIRISVGPYNTIGEMEYTSNAINRIVKRI